MQIIQKKGNMKKSFLMFVRSLSYVNIQYTRFACNSEYGALILYLKQWF